MCLINRKSNRGERGVFLSILLSCLLAPITLQASDPELPVRTVQTAIGPEMVDIRGGCFQMGSPASEEGRRNTERQHRVCVEDFSLGKYEVTVAEFRRFVDTTGYRTDAETVKGCYFFDVHNLIWKQHSWANWKKPTEARVNTDRDPVSCMSWNDSVAYIDWMNRETKGNYRLPTEAEWEYAARAGTTTRFFWGDDEASICTYANGADQSLRKHFPERKPSSSSCQDGNTFMAPVGSFQANGFGLYDTSGNVAEWTCSLYKADFDGNEMRCAAKEMIGMHTVRGGAWLDASRYLRSAIRSPFENEKHGLGTPGMDVSSNFLGFRLASDL
uniref:Formylglycine-generating enzyme, required for sulfatase activity, contains SUMF1/FGE domain n=1 Tax=Candidatus Kentrum sp. DK TaxID=2126562 RepID=A0A450SL96_9GAMM|nr:MAG: Formylglycine-generating enzyme, required for sulfatase activity, contains SUMF1/FGE domain [Candidatus Kentron sp. DK]